MVGVLGQAPIPEIESMAPPDTVGGGASLFLQGPAGAHEVAHRPSHYPCPNAVRMELFSTSVFKAFM